MQRAIFFASDKVHPLANRSKGLDYIMPYRKKMDPNYFEIMSQKMRC